MRSLHWRALSATLMLALICLSSSWAAGFRDIEPAGLADGAGVWANIWNYPQGDLDAYCSNLRSHGIRNVFIQTSRSNTEAIKEPEKLGALIDACHRHNIRVIAWSFALLHDPVADAEKMVVAAQFESPNGNRIDGVAPNLEQNLLQSKVEAYSKHLRERLGNNYPMMAVVYSPLNRAPEVARIPWKTLAKYYDVIAPMSYWNSKYQKLDAYDYTIATCRKVRELTGKPDIEIHIVGDGMGTGSKSIHDFMRGCKVAEATSASLYPNQLMTAEQYATMARYQDYFQPNSRFRLAAFSQMLKTGAVAAPESGDPAQHITRGEFYKLVVKHLRPKGKNHHAADITWQEAVAVLTGVGLVPDAAVPEPVLASPIYGDEALSLLAQMIEMQQLGPKHGARKKRADRWFAQPAMAEPVASRPGGAKPVNYLDACQMVLEAGSAIR